jgi:hypothetical protein
VAALGGRQIEGVRRIRRFMSFTIFMPFMFQALDTLACLFSLQC